MSEMGSFYWGWEAAKELREAWSHDKERPRLSHLLRRYLDRFSAWLKQ